VTELTLIQWLLQDIATADPRAKAQLDLLSHLIGSRDSSKGQQMEFHLNLFSDNADDDDQDTGCVSLHFTLLTDFVHC